MAARKEREERVRRRDDRERGGRKKDMERKREERERERERERELRSNLHHHSVDGIDGISQCKLVVNFLSHRRQTLY